MANGYANGSTGMESQFGAFILSLFFVASLLSCIRHFPEAMGLGRSAYVPPHLRNVQRAASNPNMTNG